MRVIVTSAATVVPDREPALDIRAEVLEKKSLKLMEPACRLGVVAVGRALAGRPGWQEIPPERRGLFVGTRPEGALEDLREALAASTREGRVDTATFGRVGVTLVNPLWLVKGLSNNIMGYACAWWDLRGPTSNRCEGRVSGLSAILEAARAVGEGRVDLAIAGGADVTPTGSGAAFVILERDDDGALVGSSGFDPDVEDGPLWEGRDLGAVGAVLSFIDAGFVGSAGDRASGLWVSVDARAGSGKTRPFGAPDPRAGADRGTSASPRSTGPRR